MARINCEKDGYWDAKGEAIFSQHERLKVMGGTDELTKMIHTKPTVEDYSTRGLQLPERLMGEHVRLTPDNFVLDDAVYDTVLAKAVNNEKKWLGDFFDDSPIVTKIDYSGSSSEEDEDSILVLYLANDFHWRGAQYLEMSGAGLTLVRFDCRDKDVQISRCMFPDSEEYHRKVNTLACVQEFTMRGLKLPYGYQLEMILLRYSRMQAVKRLKASFKVWAVVKPLASVEAVQYIESTIVEALPEYPRITSNVQAKALQEVGLEIISMVSCEHDMYYVCVCQDQKYLLSLSKTLTFLKQQVTDYRLWHMSNFNCLPEDFDSREKRAALPVITRYPTKVCSMMVGEPERGGTVI